MRVYNFSAGPSTLPQAVLEQVQAELLDFQGTGMSVMEDSHRGKRFITLAQEITENLRALLQIPDNYRILFLQGGAFGQFSAIPMNLAAPGQTVDYVNTGQWSKKAISEAQKYAKVKIVADEGKSNYCTVPLADSLISSPGSAYFHYTPNETIGGVEFPYIPKVEAPLVGDFSSTILSRPIPVSQYGVIYAGTQKNMAPSGMAVVIIHEDLLGKARETTPAIWNYDLMNENDSMLNTPPTFTWYVLGLVVEWLIKQGGLKQIALRNEAKAKALYDAIDTSDFYHNPVAKNCRSWMNVPFTLSDPQLDSEFLAGAKAAGLVNLEGHRSVGGMRASIYNAMEMAGVQALIEYMAEFERTRG